MSILYVSDLDGTLLNSRGILSAKSRDVINGLVQKGLKFTFATARSFSSASKVVKGLEISLPAITYNGAFLVNSKGEIINYTSFSDSHRDWIADTFRRRELHPFVYSMVDGAERVSWLAGKENDGMRDYLEFRQGDRRLRSAAGEKELYAGEIFYYTVIGSREKLEECAGYFAKQSFCVHTFQRELYKGNDYWLEVMPSDATKAAGLRRLKEHMGCEKVVCFGDGVNDLSMFAEADRAYAVENAHEQLKSLSTEIIGSNDNDGVASWLLDHGEWEG